MYGGYEQLLENKEACKSEFTVIDHILTRGDASKIINTLGGTPDCIVADCEDCLWDEYKKNPELSRDVKQIQVERDDKQQNYDSLLINELNLQKIDSGYGCNSKEPKAVHKENGMLCTTEVWER